MPSTRPVRQRLSRLAVAALCAASLAAPVSAPLAAGDPPPAAPATPVARRADDVARAVQKDPAWPDEIFDAEFRANVPPESLKKLLARVYGDEGSIRGLTLVRSSDDRSGRFELAGSKGGVMQMDLRVADLPGDPIRFLWIFRSVPGWKTLAQAAQGFEQWGAGTALCVRKLGEDGPPLAASRADETLDVASCAKLWILGALVEDIREGRRRWTDVVCLEPKHRSIPTGILHRWPNGSPVTLHTLAQLMVEKSDNTAADHLLALVGRGNVEDVMKANCADPSRNRPFLSTGEMFKLKYLDGGKHGAVWTTLDERARRSLLAEVISKEPVSKIDTPSESAPRFVGSVGWSASADDLCRTMEWIVRRTSEGPASDARALLAVEPGTTEPPDIHPWQGYKGGRLPGVAARAWVVRAADESLYAVAAIRNDAARDVDEARLVRMSTRVLQLLGR